ncbi:signal transduction histidine kinase [Motilibacter rhizosphaerae]|uniref:Circadian input-output histidine kinase CikA n=1 Tax=Motilibacter rhizosphaerae TaxID=598652 RepID=A0A4V2F2T9_9ACTN|nr:response regulator [Motilibacter rhizosphaerae]RZS80054.1 signal transduction histidine kinase [Motilibacter rhizosphaerae]
MTDRRPARPLRDLLARPLHVGVAALVAAVLIGTSAAAVVLLRIAPAVDRQDEVVQVLQDGHTAMVDQETGLRAYLLTRDPQFLEPYASGRAREAALDAQLGRLVAGQRRTSGEVQAMRTARAAWHAGWSDPVLRAQPDLTDRTALTSLLLQGKHLFDGYRTTETAVRTTALQRREGALRDERTAVAVAAAAELVVALLAGLFVVRSGRRLRREVLPPVQDLRHGLAALTEGDLAARVPLAGPLEVQDIGRDVNALAVALQVERGLVHARENALISAREDAERAGQAKAAFLATMSHEIRTPLNAVLGLTDLLLAGEASEEQRRHLRTIATSGDSLLTLINDILDFSKIESGELELESVPFDVAGTLLTVAELFAVQAAERGLDLLVDLGAYDEVWVVGDEGRLRQVLVNLVGNALKFTSCGQVVVALVEARDGTVEVAVRDTGIGIPADRIDVLFEPFRQADASTTRLFGGTGLGLAITSRIVTAMGGAIRVASEPGAGSCFMVRLPIPAAPSRWRSADGTSVAGLRLLVVDDNETNLQILRTQLEAADAVVLTAEDGPGGLAAYAAETAAGRRIDAVLLDSDMPGMDGIEVARELARRPEGTRPVCLLLSSPAAVRPLDRPLFAARLQKPVRPLKLRRTIANTVDAGTGSGAGAGLGRADEPLRVLVAEDNPVNQELMRAYLARLGHDADLVDDGAAAVEAVRTRDYDVVLMDGQMPVLDGLEATAEIRRLGGRQPHVVAVTASAFATDREAFLRAGADSFLAKPLRLEVLAAALSRIADTRGAAQQGAEPDGTTAEWRWEPEAAYAGVLDPRTVGEMTALGTGEMRQLYEGFGRNLATAAERLRGLADGDPEGLAPALHKLRGSSGSFGAARLAVACAAAEALVGTAEPAVVVGEVLALAAEAVGAVEALVASLPEDAAAEEQGASAGW